MHATLAPKLLGTRLLWRNAMHLPLRSFAAFSSIAAFLGTPGQASYAAANASMDTLVSILHGAGIAGTCVFQAEMALLPCCSCFSHEVALAKT